jgi:hypothetical protein
VPVVVELLHPMITLSAIPTTITLLMTVKCAR